MFKIGDRVKFKSSEMINPNFWGKTGIVKEAFDHECCRVLMDVPIYGGRGPYTANNWMMEVINLSPEEKAQRLEECRKAEEQRLDQERRLEHAMKYL